MGKKKIKHLSIRFSKKLARKKRFSRRVFKAQLNDLIKSNKRNNNSEKIEHVKKEILDIDNKAVEGAKIRTKERF